MINDHKSMIEGLSHLLADTYVLYVQTQNFHWNVTGINFYSHHKMFEEQYQELAEATDTLAERIRALHAFAPGTLSEFLALTSLKEVAGNQLNDHAMIKTLLDHHEQICKRIIDLFEVAKKCDDEVTMDLLIQRKTEHDKIAWMLNSILK